MTSLLGLSGRRDSNPRRQPWQGCTLPLSYSRGFQRGSTERPRHCQARTAVRPACPTGNRYLVHRSAAHDPRSLHLDDALHLGEGTHHGLELSQVLAREREDVARASVVPRATIRLTDVDFLRAECLAHVGEDARSVQRRHLELHRAIDLRVGLPCYLDATFGVRIERLLALPAMNGDAP